MHIKEPEIQSLRAPFKASTTCLHPCCSSLARCWDAKPILVKVSLRKLCKHLWKINALLTCSAALESSCCPTLREKFLLPPSEALKSEKCSSQSGGESHSAVTVGLPTFFRRLLSLLSHLHGEKKSSCPSHTQQKSTEGSASEWSASSGDPWSRENATPKKKMPTCRVQIRDKVGESVAHAVGCAPLCARRPQQQVSEIK